LEEEKNIWIAKIWDVVVNKCNYISVVCRPTSDQETPFYRIFPVEFNKENRSSLFPITLAKQFLTAIFK
jgi:hypothetical protein